jgi:hypothetical protein
MAITTAHTTVTTIADAPAMAAKPRLKLRTRLAAYIEALREGMAMSRRYEALKGQGFTHDRALAKAMSETGFGG